jgi:hypothetical protein
MGRSHVSNVLKRYYFESPQKDCTVVVQGWSEAGARESWRRNLCEERKKWADAPLIRVEDVVIGSEEE